MDQTDVFFRQLCRLVSKHTWLYTEMVVDKTLIFNPQACCIFGSICSHELAGSSS